jgi:YD repeat-containing protein
MAYSQNTGPTAPEAQGFEPIDGQNMVNLNTGDLSYVMPLLHIPGPGGGYPISLSYHGGVQEGQEATWVGLGWNINPGAINRSLSGNPDDCLDAKQFTIQHIDPTSDVTTNWWLGLDISVFHLTYNQTRGAFRSSGVSVSYSGITGSYSRANNDGVTGNLWGISAPMGLASFNGANYSDGTDSYGAGYFGIEANWGNKAEFSMKGGATAGFVGGVVNDLSSGDFGSATYSLIGVGSMNFGSTYSSNDYVLRQSGWQEGYFLFGRGKTTNTYWLNKITDHLVYGSLYNYHSSNEDDGYWGLQKLKNKTDVIELFENPEEKFGLYFPGQNVQLPAYDNFNISAQGLSGSMSLKYLSAGLIAGNGKIVDTYENGRSKQEVRYHHSSVPLNRLTSNEPEFYFTKGNESYYMNTPGSFSIDENGQVQYQNEVLETENDLGQSNFDVVNKELYTSKYTKVYRTQEIVGALTDPGLKEFMETESFDRNEYYNYNSDKYTIGAFAITDNNGITYHYSLPVYQFESVDHFDIATNQYVEYRQNYKYAIAWLLTGITGSDFVDINENHLIDDGDIGYWVKFNYGKWADGYIWQLPFEESETEGEINYSRGRKQIYYLNSIETATHAALFVKDKRPDGFSKSVLENNNIKVVSIKEHASAIDEFFDPIFDVETNTTVEYFETEFNAGKVSPLRLNKIVLIKKSDLPSNPEHTQSSGSFASLVNGNYTFRKEYRLYSEYGEEDEELLDTYHKADADYSVSFQSQFESNVLDIKDDISLQLNNKALKVIDFIYDEANPLGNAINSDYSNNGILTLTGIEFKGQKGIKMIPAYKFDYYNYQESDYDSWGFDIDHPENYSLKSIMTPIGSSLNIEYESDTYSLAAAMRSTAYTSQYVETEDVTIEEVEGELYGTASFDVSEIPSSVLSSPGKSYSLSGLIPILCDVDPAIETYLYNGGENFYSYDYETIEGDEYVLDLSAKKVNVTWKIFNNSIFNFDNCAYNEDGNLAVGLNIHVPDNQIIGGGLRVSKIFVDDHSYTTYDYSDPETAFSSGVTTYAPFDNMFFIKYQELLPSPYVFYKNVTINNLDKNDKLINSSRISFNVYAPRTISSSPLSESNYTIADLLKIKINQNEYLNKEFIYDVNGTLVGDARTFAKTTEIIDHLANLGQIESIESYNAAGDVLQKVSYQYTQPESMNSGVVSENFYSIQRIVNFTSSDGVYYDSDFLYSSFSKNEYTSQLKSQLVENAFGSLLTEYESYNIYDGFPTSIKSKNIGTGNEVRIEQIQSYTVTGYENMGLKSINKANKNMLGALSVNLVSKKVADNFKPLSANIASYNNDWSYTYLEWNKNNGKFEYNGSMPIGTTDTWRRHKTFTWNGTLDWDGTYGNDFDTYEDINNLKTNWNSYFGGGDYGNWLKTSEIKRYDHSSSPVEVMDMNGDYAATRKDPNNAYSIATAANASLASFSATSFEDFEELPVTSGTKPYHYGGEFIDKAPYSSRFKSSDAPSDIEGDIISGIKSHSGYYYLKVNAGQNGPMYTNSTTNNLLTGRKYRASVWVHKSSHENAALCVTVGGQSMIQKKKSEGDGQFGDWVLVNLDFDVEASDTEFEVFVKAGPSGVSYFDDFRVNPFNASVTSFTYDKAGNVTAILNGDNFATKYHYDAAGRLVRAERETDKGFQKVSAYSYNYAGRISVSPSTEQLIDCEGVDNMEFGYLKSPDLSLVFEKPAWISNITVYANILQVDIEPNNCSERTGELVVKTNPATDEVRIPIRQKAPPKYYNIYFTHEDNSPLTENIFRVGNKYKIWFNYCDGFDLDVTVYQTDNRPVNKIWDNAASSYHDDNDAYILWEVPNKPQPEQQGLNWTYNSTAYYIALETSAEGDLEKYQTTGTFSIGRPVVTTTQQQLTFVSPGNNYIMPVHSVTEGHNYYETEVEWTFEGYNYRNLCFNLEVWSADPSSGPNGKYLFDIPLPDNDHAWCNIGAGTEGGSLTWSFMDNDLVSWISLTATTAQRQSSYAYRIVAREMQEIPNACTNCPSAYSDWLTITDVDFDW